MKNRINSEFSFEVWMNNDFDAMAHETGSFDDNWLISASDLFGQMDLPADDTVNYYDEAA